jgi:MFS family permease
MSKSRKQLQLLERNIAVYSWLKIFTKRAFLPLFYIYLAEAGHLSVGQIGFLVSWGAAISLLSGIPTGHFADRTQRKTSLITGALLLVVSALLLAALPSFIGAIIAVTVQTLGFAFISGAGEALMHDTMVALDRTHDYVKVMGRAQSVGLIGNMVVVGLVPLTYGFDKRLPFLIGALTSCALAWAALALVEPERVRTKAPSRNILTNINVALRTFLNRRTMWIFLAIGLMSAIYAVYASYINLVYKDLHINVSLIGFVYAASSIVGAIGGLFVHHLKKVPFVAYTLFDLGMGTATLIIIGLSRNLWVAIIIGLINMGFWRLRNIIYQDNLLRQLGSTGNKATLVSALSFFDDINELWLPWLFASTIAAFGYYDGFVSLGLGAIIVIAPLSIIGARLLTPLRMQPNKT